MENSIYLGLSRQMTLQTNMGITANNIANMNTPGYRGQNMLFAEYISKPRGYDDPLSFVYDRGQYQITDEGPMQQTDNPMDIALVGPGMFEVEGPGGAQTYSRSGNFQLGTDGTLQTSRGFRVMNEGGAPINIPEDASEVKIDQFGVISTQNGEIGRLNIVEFANIQDIEAMGDNLYRSNIPPAPATQTRVRQGFIEGSNVNAVLEMTNMIEVSRSFQSMQNAMQVENDRLRKAIQTLTRTN